MKNVRASVDIGSNSVLLLLAQVSPYREIARLSEITALGKGLDRTGKFDPVSMQDTLQALKHYAEVCGQQGIQPCEILATATEAARVAANASEFFQKVKNEIGIEVKIITSDAEAALTTKGILFNSSFSDDEVNVMDIGGASTELILVDVKSLSIKSSVSLPVGAVRSSDWIKDGTFDGKMSSLKKEYGERLSHYECSTLHCVAGSMTSIANMHLGNKTFNEDDVHGLRLKRSDIEEVCARYASMTPAAILERFPFLGKRSQAIGGGLRWSVTILDWLKVQDVTISTYGLRFGTFLEGRIRDEYLA